MRLGFAIGFLLTTASLAKEIDNPLYHDWASHRIGTIVKYSIVTVRNGYRMEVQRTTRLVAVTSEKVVLEESAAMEAGDSNVDFSPNKTEVAARIESAKGAMPPAPIAQGRETLTVGK